MILLTLFAFLAGIVTILSPCILPILPIVLSSTIGGKETGKARPIGVVLGFIASFTFFTLFLSTIVQISGISADALRLISVIIIAGFGASLLIPHFQVLIERIFSKLSQFVPQGNTKPGLGAGLIVGVSLGLLWTPCVGPILASVISLAITGTVTLDAFILTFAYSLGTAIPMFLIMIGGQSVLRKVPWLLTNSANIQKVFGVLMIITAIGILNNVDRKFQTYILTTFPQYGIGLTNFENNDAVKKQLNTLTGKETKNEDMGKAMFDITAPKGPKAPEIIPGGVWFNSKPLKIEELRGKVVIIDFWTYTCINCQRTFPYLRAWHEKYKDKGLVIIGVHSPEFEFEKNEKNVKQAIDDFKLQYPVVQDNNFDTWKAYDNQYWPAKYIVDNDGYIRYTHFGEGAYDETERVIQELLKEAGQQVSTPVETVKETNSRSVITPEIYLGSQRMEYLANTGKATNGNRNFILEQNIPLNNFSYGGNWTIANQYSSSGRDAVMELNFTASKIFLVMNPGREPGKVKVLLDGKVVTAANAGTDVKNGIVTIDKDRLYNLIDLKGKSEKHLLRLEFQTPGIEAFALTFG